MEDGSVKIKLMLAGLVFLIYVPLLAGCEMNNPIIKEMDSAYLAVSEKKIVHMRKN